MTPATPSTTRRPRLLRVTAAVGSIGILAAGATLGLRESATQGTASSDVTSASAAGDSGTTSSGTPASVSAASANASAVAQSGGS